MSDLKMLYATINLGGGPSRALAVQYQLYIASILCDLWGQTRFTSSAPLHCALRD